MSRIPSRRGRLPAFALLFALLASLVPIATVYAAVTSRGDRRRHGDLGRPLRDRQLHDAHRAVDQGEPSLARLRARHDRARPAAADSSSTPAVGNVSIDGGAGCPTLGALAVDRDDGDRDLHGDDRVDGRQLHHHVRRPAGPAHERHAVDVRRTSPRAGRAGGVRRRRTNYGRLQTGRRAPSRTSSGSRSPARTATAATCSAHAARDPRA